MLTEGGRGTLFRVPICGDEYRPFIPPFREFICGDEYRPPATPLVAPMLRDPKFPAFGGRGTERAPIEPFIVLELLNPGLELLNPGLELLNAGPRFVLPIAGRCILLIWPGLATLELKPPRPAELKPPRFAIAARLTTGREKARDGGTAALTPLEPMMLARVGMTPSECTAVMRLIWFGAMRKLLCATESEFTSVVRDTTVNPPGRRIFA
jgi:hypothetical protein